MEAGLKLGIVTGLFFLILKRLLLLVWSVM